VSELLISNFGAKEDKEGIIGEVRKGIDASNNRTHIEHKAGDSTLPIVYADPGSSDVVVEV
jgi:hypothetical protein